MAEEKLTPSQERELYEMKLKAIQYYSENGVPQRMEEVLNNMFYDAPTCVYGHLSNYFATFSKTPTVSKLACREVLDSKGQMALQTDVYCTVKNIVKLVCSSVSPNEGYPHDGIKNEEREEAEGERAKALTVAQQLISGEISLALWGIDPCKQSEIDGAAEGVIQKLKEEEEEEKLKAQVEDEPSPCDITPPSESPSKGKGKVPSAKGKKGGKEAAPVVPTEPREKFFCGSNAMSAISQAVCQAAASANDLPLYEHVASLKFDEIPCAFKMPLPIVTILGSGKGALGKLNCVKEFMVVPRVGFSLNEAMKEISAVYNFCAKAISVKGGMAARYVNDIGALCPTYDRPEQGLDLLQEALTALELTEKFTIALNCASHETFDMDKGKYEVTIGLMKSSEDLVDFWSDMLNRYPSVNILIDPIRKEDQESWMKLCGAVSEKCLVIGNAAYHRPGLLKNEEITPSFKSSGVIMQMENVNTVSDIIASAKKLEDVDHHVGIGANNSESCDTFLADLAVGMQACFIKIGAPCRADRVAKLNRLTQIENELEEKGRLRKSEDLAFPSVRPPSPDPEEHESPVPTPDSKKEKK
ncbi:hypothetical protein CAPTEDRAFT_221626 [Capitella teleta]|uniref:Enolase 4 n=1 Tax=Capitella teleta TaxID=283909 RepID=R7UKK6_CAPTE|nr:hypothetical protein CAPTEDRAFT_221626 [Capitella teleta]|eukprot:ELU06760.1 hypothetical protein CAPTEDRAFT_221626 [Capitella teleta]